MKRYIVPDVGSRGKFYLNPPLQQLPSAGEEYTCQAIRKLSDYVANNEDPLTDIYKEYELTEDDYKKDLAEDMLIASLQSDSGHWLYVPVKYIQTQPDANGVPYRTLMIGVSIGAQPVQSDFTHIEDEIRDIVIKTLGVSPVIKQVQTSKPVLIPVDKHEEMVAARLHRTQQALTDGLKYRGLQLQHQQALDTIRILEDYIRQNLPVGQ